MTLRLFDKGGRVFAEPLGQAVAGSTVALDLELDLTDPQLCSTGQCLQPVQLYSELLAQVSRLVSKGSHLVQGNEERLPMCLAKATVTFKAFARDGHEFRDRL